MLQVTEEDLINMSAELEDYKKLRGGVVFLDELPQSASGKVAKGTLIKLAKEIHNIKD